MSGARVARPIARISTRPVEVRAARIALILHRFFFDRGPRLPALLRFAL
jgi:hypothetical protein